MCRRSRLIKILLTSSLLLITSNMVGIVQLAEHRIVVPGVVGSSPITHPIKKQGYHLVSLFFYMGIWGNGARKADQKICRWHIFPPWESP